MPVHPSVKVCTHIKVTGIRCGSPALRGEQFCYFHQRAIRGVPTPPSSRLHPIAIIENEESIQSALMEIINALARNTIDFRRAELIIRALQVAVRNCRRVRFDAPDSVVQVPDYPAPPKPVRPPEPADTVASVETCRPSLFNPEPPELEDYRDAKEWDSPDTSQLSPSQRKPPGRANESRRQSPTRAARSAR